MPNLDDTTAGPPDLAGITAAAVAALGDTVLGHELARALEPDDPVAGPVANHDSYV